MAVLRGMRPVGRRGRRVFRLPATPAEAPARSTGWLACAVALGAVLGLSAAPVPAHTGAPSALSRSALLDHRMASSRGSIGTVSAKAGENFWNVQRRRTSGADEVEYATAFLKKIRQRTKTRQISGGENLNVMEWTTQKGPRPTMEGAIIYFKLFKSAFKFFNSRFNEFLEELPDKWEDYGKYQEPAKKFSNGDIKFANQFVIDMFNWFKPKQKIIGNQGGVLIFFSGGRGYGSMIAYTDPNEYKENNVAGILTGQSYIRRAKLSDDVFLLPKGADEFIQFIIEDQEGPVKIELPYILYKVPAR
ncbi:MAG: hypothetical protein ACE5JZ_00745 [Kiloniellales bacterium]